jgi:leukotriene-A4 hydrolase
MARQDPHSYADLTQGKISHIGLRIKVDFNTQILEVEADYQIEEPVSGSLFLDTAGIDLKQAIANGQDLGWEFGDRDELLGERLHLKNLDNVDSFKLLFNTSSEARALQWLPAAQTAGKVHPFMYSQCQAIHARSVFPCQDTPSARFTYSAEVDVPKALMAVVAAEPVGVRETGKSRIFQFNMPQPIPSYLFAIGVGNLVFSELGPRTGVYAEPEIIEAAAWEFAENEAKLAEAEKLLGPYLWGRYDLLILPPSFPYGGMENPRLTFLMPSVILGNRKRTTIISHELAHAWTGNLVTNATWEDFWLNEGWTTYAQARIDEVLEGKDVADLMTASTENRLLEYMERVGMDSPLTRLKVPLEGQDPEENVTIIPYIKGHFFLNECEYCVGRERFDAFIKKYIGTFQFQSLTTEGFLSFMKEELPETFESLDVQRWVYDSGLPEERTKPTSVLYDEVQDVLTAYQNGRRPTKEQLASWHYYQIAAFLRALPKQIPVKDCQYFEDVFDLKDKNDAVFYSSFYCTCITSGYQDILPHVEEFLGGIGNLYYNLQIFRALIESEWAKVHARRMFEQTRSQRHMIAVHMIDGLLKKANL